MPRVYPQAGQERARRIDYRHFIHSLSAKLQAFRFLQFRDEVLLTETYRASWRHCDQQLPTGKSFANLNLAELSADVKQQIVALKDQTDWAHHAGDILLIGPSGVGKSHIAAAIARQLIEQNARVKWIEIEGESYRKKQSLKK